MQGGPVVQGSGGGGDRLVTQVITLRNESAAQLVNVLRPLITPNNTIAAYPGEQRAVITDYAENLRAHRQDHRVARPAARRRADARAGASTRRRSTSCSSSTGCSATAAPRDAGRRAADPQQRVTLVADPRSQQHPAALGQRGARRARHAR